MYSAVVLDQKSKTRLVDWANENIKLNNIRLPILVSQNGWKMVCNHMTIQFGGTPDYIKQYLGTVQTLEVTHIGMNSKVIAVRVIGFPSTNKNAHITVAVNYRNGGRPAMSNEIDEWRLVSGGPTLKGTVEEKE